MNLNRGTQQDNTTSKTGMWLFLFAEMLLFGGLFVVLSVFRYRNAIAFRFAAQELSLVSGTINTVILLISSMTIAISITAFQKQNKKLALLLLGSTFFLGLAFLVIKFFELEGHIKNHIYPGSAVLFLRGQGDALFFGLYFFITGLHAIHIIIGLVFTGIITVLVFRDRTNAESIVFHEKSELYWHLITLIGIFLFPLFYLIA